MELEYKDDVAAPWDDHQSIPHGQNCLDRYFCHRQSFSDGDYDSVPIAYDRPKDMMEKKLIPADCMFWVIAPKQMKIGRCGSRHWNRRKTFFPMPQTSSSYHFLFRSYNLKQSQLPDKNEVFIG